MQLGKRAGGRGQKLYHYGGTETFEKAIAFNHWPTKRQKLIGKLKNILSPSKIHHHIIVAQKTGCNSDLQLKYLQNTDSLWVSV